MDSDTKDYNNLIIGEPGEEIEFDSLEDNRAILRVMAKQARRSIMLFSRDLEPRLYDDAEFITEVIRLATSSRYASVRILIRDPEKSLKSGHRIIETARRFSTNIHIHRLSEDYHEHYESFVVFDETAWIWRKIASYYEGIASFQRNLRTRDLVQLFNNAWEASEVDHEMRRLHL